MCLGCGVLDMGRTHTSTQTALRRKVESSTLGFTRGDWLASGSFVGLDTHAALEQSGGLKNTHDACRYRTTF